MKKIILRRQTVLMWAGTESEYSVKRQVEYLPVSQLKEEYGPTGLMLELAGRGDLGFARAKISGKVWILCRQFEGNPWQAVGWHNGLGFTCMTPQPETKPEPKESWVDTRTQKAMKKRMLDEAVSKLPTVRMARQMAAIASTVAPPHRTSREKPGSIDAVDVVD